MNGIMFSFDLFWKIFGKVGFFFYGKDVLEFLYDLYVNKKIIVSIDYIYVIGESYVL